MKLKTIQTLTIFFGKLKPLPLFLSTLDKFTHRIDTFPLQLLCKGLCAVTTLFQFQKPRLSNFRCPLFPSCTFLCLSHASSDRILLLYSHCYPTWFCYNNTLYIRMYLYCCLYKRPFYGLEYGALYKCLHFISHVLLLIYSFHFIFSLWYHFHIPN